MKKLFYILLITVLASCDNVNVAPGPGPLVTTKDNNSYSKNPVEIEKDSELSEDDSPERGVGIEEDTSPSLKDQGAYENPFFIYGTDFGNFFQTLYVHGKYEQMIAFTSSQSISQFGKENILEFYKNDLDFGYDIGKYPLSSGTSGDIITINYNAKIMATDKVVRVNVIVENDSCKIVLPNNLKNFPS